MAKVSLFWDPRGQNRPITVLNQGTHIIYHGGSAADGRKYKIKGIWREPQGLVSGKRCGIFQNIGPTASKRSREPQGHPKVQVARLP